MMKWRRQQYDAPQQALPPAQQLSQQQQQTSPNGDGGSIRTRMVVKEEGGWGPCSGF